MVPEEAPDLASDKRGPGLYLGAPPYSDPGRGTSGRCLLCAVLAKHWPGPGTPPSCTPSPTGFRVMPQSTQKPEPFLLE